MTAETAGHAKSVAMTAGRTNVPNAWIKGVVAHEEYAHR
jgi:hypothetical protein